MNFLKGIFCAIYILFIVCAIFGAGYFSSYRKVLEAESQIKFLEEQRVAAARIIEKQREVIKHNKTARVE
jgi:hypothetical protein